MYVIYIYVIHITIDKLYFIKYIYIRNRKYCDQTNSFYYVQTKQKTCKWLLKVKWFLEVYVQVYRNLSWFSLVDLKQYLFQEIVKLYLMLLCWDDSKSCIQWFDLFFSSGMELDPIWFSGFAPNADSIMNEKGNLSYSFFNLYMVWAKLVKCLVLT